MKSAPSPDPAVVLPAPTARVQSVRSCVFRVAAIAFVLGITIGIVANRRQMGDFATLGYAGAFLAMVLSNATLILPAPGLIVVFALGSSFNPLVLGVAGGLGATLGEVTGYLTGYSGLGVMEHSPITARINRWMDRNGMLTIFALAVFPNPFFDMAGVVAGAGRMSLLRFFAVTFCGKAIQATLVALAGMLSLGWVESLLVH